MSVDEHKDTSYELETTNPHKTAVSGTIDVETLVNRIRQELGGIIKEDKESFEDRKFIIVFALVLLNGLFIYMLISLL